MPAPQTPYPRVWDISSRFSLLPEIGRRVYSLPMAMRPMFLPGVERNPQPAPYAELMDDAGSGSLVPADLAHVCFPPEATDHLARFTQEILRGPSPLTALVAGADCRVYLGAERLSVLTEVPRRSCGGIVRERGTGAGRPQRSGVLGIAGTGERRCCDSCRRSTAIRGRLRRKICSCGTSPDGPTTPFITPSRVLALRPGAHATRRPRRSAASRESPSTGAAPTRRRGR